MKTKPSENSRLEAVVRTVERGVVRLVGIPDPRNSGRDEACRVNRTDLAGALVLAEKGLVELHEGVAAAGVLPAEAMVSLGLRGAESC